MDTTFTRGLDLVDNPVLVPIHGQGVNVKDPDSLESSSDFFAVIFTIIFLIILLYGIYYLFLWMFPNFWQRVAYVPRN